MNQDKYSHTDDEVASKHEEIEPSEPKAQESPDLNEDENIEISYILDKIAAKWRGEEPPEHPKNVMPQPVSAKPEDISDKTVILNSSPQGNPADMDKTVLLSQKEIPVSSMPAPEKPLTESADETVILNASKRIPEEKKTSPTQAEHMHPPEKKPADSADDQDKTIILGASNLGGGNLGVNDAPPSLSSNTPDVPPQPAEPEKIDDKKATAPETFDPDATLIIGKDLKDLPTAAEKPHIPSKPLEPEKSSDTDIPPADHTIMLKKKPETPPVDMDETLIMGASPKNAPAPEAKETPEPQAPAEPEHDQTISIQSFTHTSETMIIDNKDAASLKEKITEPDPKPPVPPAQEKVEDDADDDVILETVILGPNSYE